MKEYLAVEIDYDDPGICCTLDDIVIELQEHNGVSVKRVVIDNIPFADVETLH